MGWQRNIRLMPVNMRKDLYKSRFGYNRNLCGSHKDMKAFLMDICLTKEATVKLFPHIDRPHYFYERLSGLKGCMSGVYRCL